MPWFRRMRSCRSRPSSFVVTTPPSPVVRTFVGKNAKGETVNRTPGIGWIGGCTDTNEFNYLQWRVISALGVPYRDSQARV